MDIVIGIGCGLIAWWLLYHGLSPRITFPTAPKRDRDKADFESESYEWNIFNAGWRKAEDLEIIVRFKHRINDTGRTRNHDFPSWQSKCVALTSRNNRYVIFDPCSMVRENKDFFEAEIVGKAIKGTLTLSELLMLRDAQIQVFVFATDSFSGRRKLFSSSNYTRHQLQDIDSTDYRRE
jgi:hypothetical protein